MSISSPTSSRPAGGGHQDVFVVAVRRQRVFTVAITTKKDKTGRTLPIPNNVADRAGLARGTSVVVDQYDHFTWLGYPAGDGRALLYRWPHAAGFPEQPPYRADGKVYGHQPGLTGQLSDLIRK